MANNISSSILDRVRAAHKNAPIADTIQGAVKWYQAQIRKLGGTNQTKLLADNKRARSFFYPGFMYMFLYDAKNKKTLPYWDRWPLIIPVDFYKGGFSGINLHYLDYKSRLLLFHELLTLADKHPTDPRARILLSYKSLKRMVRFRAFKPCFHRYLSSHVASHCVKIEAPDWETALFLPVENFQKAPKTWAWKQSQEIIAGTRKYPTGKNVVSTNGLPRNS